jgi:hypothetical protein
METAEKPTKTAVINQVQKKVRMELWDIVKFQIVVYCNINKIQLAEQEIDCLSLLAVIGNSELTGFCTEAIKQNISGSTQSIRNALAKIEKKGLIVKTGRSKKRISINPVMNVQVQGNILLDYKIIRIDPSEG